MERHDTPVAIDELTELPEHEPSSEEAQVERLVAWYFGSTPGSALERRRAAADRLLSRLRISRRAA
jgi:hypothetical protein